MVQVCGQGVADLLELGEAIGPLLVLLLFDGTLGLGLGLGALDAVVHCPLALDQLGVVLLAHQPLWLQRNQA